MSQVDHPDRRKCKPSQTKKQRTTVNQQDDVHKPGRLPNNAQRTKDTKGRTADWTGLCQPQPWLQIRRKTTATLKTLREMPPPPFISLLCLPTSVSFSPVDTASISKGLQSLLDHSHPTWKLRCRRKGPPGRYSIDRAAKGMTYL